MENKKEMSNLTASIIAGAGLGGMILLGGFTAPVSIALGTMVVSSLVGFN